MHGTREKPYYEIKYHDLSDGQTHIGYSSYNLDFVFDWLEECFEIINQAADTIESLSAKLQAANMENGGGWIACEDRMPQNFEVVLAFTEEKQIVTVARDGEDWVLYNQGIIKEKVLAWQPLPEPYRP